MTLKTILSRFAVGSIVAVGLLLECGWVQAARVPYDCPTGVLRCYISTSFKAFFQTCCNNSGEITWESDLFCSAPEIGRPIVDSFQLYDDGGGTPINISNCPVTSKYNNEGSFVSKIPGCNKPSDWKCMTVNMSASSPVTWETLKKSKG